MMTTNKHHTINDCWNQIGVRGDRSCPELATTIHCHYCQIYIQTSRQLLQQPPLASDVAEWTQIVEKPKAEHIVGTCSIVLFRIGNINLALPTAMVEEITNTRKPYQVPHRNNPIFRGLINLNGRLQPCMSLGKLFHIDKTQEPSSDERLIVISKQQRLLTFYVSQTYGVQRYHPDQLQQAPANLSTDMMGYTLGMLTWNDKHVACLNGDQLFDFLESLLNV